MRRIVLGVVMLCAACADDITGYRSINGAYALRSVNGAPLPYTIASGSSAGMVIVADTIKVFEGGTFARPMQFRATANAPVETRLETGTQVLFRSSLSLRSNESGKVQVATINGTTLTVVEAGTTSVYRK